MIVVMATTAAVITRTMHMTVMILKLMAFVTMTMMKVKLLLQGFLEIKRGK